MRQNWPVGEIMSHFLLPEQELGSTTILRLTILFFPAILLSFYVSGFYWVKKWSDYGNHKVILSVGFNHLLSYGPLTILCHKFLKPKTGGTPHDIGGVYVHISLYLYSWTVSSMAVLVKSLVVETRSSPVNEGNEDQKAWIFSNDTITQNFTYNIISLPAVWVSLIW